MVVGVAGPDEPRRFVQVHLVAVAVDHDRSEVDESLQVHPTDGFKDVAEAVDVDADHFLAGGPVGHPRGTVKNVRRARHALSQLFGRIGDVAGHTLHPQRPQEAGQVNPVAGNTPRPPREENKRNKPAAAGVSSCRLIKNAVMSSASWRVSRRRGMRLSGL